MRRASRIIRNILFYTPVVLSSVIAILSLVLLFSLYNEMKGKTISIHVDNDTEGIEDAGYSENINYADPLLSKRKIILTTDINRRMSFAFINKLLYLGSEKDKTPIDLYIRTDGGKYSDAFAIADAMKLVPAPVNVHVLGSCESAGLIILLGATGKRTAAPNTLFMLHKTFDADDVKEPLTQDYMDIRRVEDLLKAKAKLPEKWFPLTGKETLYFSANEALKYGLIDAIKP